MADLENQRQSISQNEPLLAADRRRDRELDESQDIIGCHVVKVHGDETWIWRLRKQLRRFLGGKSGHYFVLSLVSLDIASIFADFLISLHVCEHSHEAGFDTKPWTRADEVLDLTMLTISCLFMAELFGSIFAFGFGYFKSKFHIFDATVILASFVVDVVLRGLDEDLGSLIIIGRLWRMFKIIEEFGSGAEDSITELQERVEELERHNEDLSKENDRLRNMGDQSPAMDGHAT